MVSAVGFVVTVGTAGCWVGFGVCGGAGEMVGAGVSGGVENVR